MQIAKALGLVAMLWCAGIITVSCSPDLESGVYRCDPKATNACPSGWVCQARGAGVEHRCYDSEAGYCGDGKVDPGEDCDGVAFERESVCSGRGYAYCRVDCRAECTVCGDGKLEATPSGEREECDDGNLVDGDGCSAQCRLARCGDGIVDPSLFEACDLGAANSDAPGAACRTNCQPRRCGDRVVDALHGEVCDDGNLAATDGCTPDCKSNETCGNGYVDFLLDESCDDANARSHDGCSSTCLNEVLAWRSSPTDLGAYVSGRSGFSMAYDTARGRLVVFGGMRPFHEGSVYLNDTVEWNGSSWLSFPQMESPSPRRGQIMAYDAYRNRMVLFGGYGPGITLPETWEWNGATWTLRSVKGVGPESIIYDPTRKRVVGFSADKTQVFEWYGEKRDPEWISHQVGNSPSFVTNVVFHPQRGRIVGFTDDEMAEFDWSTLQWSIFGVPQPPPDVAAGDFVIWDVETQAILRMNSELEVWAWQPITQLWVKRDTPPVAEVQPYCRVSQDLHRKEMIAFCGSLSWPPEDPVMLIYYATGWQELTISQPIAPSSGVDVFDRLRGRLVRFSGLSDPSVQEWDGSIWSNLDQGGLHFIPYLSVFDIGRDRVVAYDNSTDTTWEWSRDGRRGLPALPSDPNLSWWSKLIYNEQRGVSLIGSSALNEREVYYLNGEQWRADGFSLDVRSHYPGIVYDALRSSIVAVGGWMPNRLSRRVDEYMGGSWREVEVSSGPPAGEGNVMAFDFARARMLCFRDASTWEFSIAAASSSEQPSLGTWKQVYPIGSSQPSVWRLVYDSIRQGLLSPDLSLLQYRNPNTPEETCIFGVDADGDGKIGCDDPDCWGRCTPTCAPGIPCAITLTGPAPRCGDNVCNVYLENCRLCPNDCGACTVSCGDFLCDAPESPDTCPGDCPITAHPPSLPTLR